MYKLALIGCGYLSEIVANAVANGILPEYELVGILGRNPKTAEAFASRHHCKMCGTIKELMALKPDFTAEAASVQSIRDYSEVILNNGSNLVVLSIGAFADATLYQKVQETAVKNNRKVYIASGAVGGFDVIQTAALMESANVSFHSRKAPASLVHTPLNKTGLQDITDPQSVFSGTAADAIAILPGHVNVAVATSLASVGPDRMQVNIEAVPGFQGDEYKIEVHGKEVRTDLNIYSRTSQIAGWSVVRILRNAVAPVVF